jgi:F-type H+-transporting ATPase subunit alpha
LDAASKEKIERGKRIVEILKQPQYSPVAVEKQVLIFWLATKGYLDEVPLVECNGRASEFASYVLQKENKFAQDVVLSEGLTKDLDKKIQGYAEKYFKVK